jgi:hypothetical protein
MRFFDKIRRWIQRLTPLESAVLNSVIAALPKEEGQALQIQIRAALFDRQMGSRMMAFHFPKGMPIPPIERLVGKGRLVLAIVKAQGQASRFTTTVKVTCSNGLIYELSFDLMPWSGVESFNAECEIVGLPQASDSPRAAENADQEPSERHRS